MKKFSIILGTMLMVVLLAGCSNDSGGGNSVEGISQGTGPQLNLTSKTEVEMIVEGLLEDQQEILTDQSVDSYSYSIETTPVAPATPNKFSLLKTTNSENPIYEFCTKGSYSKDFNAYILNGSTGTASLTGSYEITKTGDDSADANIDIESKFTNFYRRRISNKKYFITGTSSVKVESSITKGLDVMCNMFMATTEPNFDCPSENEVAGDLYEHFMGSFSISGDAGAAITFDYTVKGTETIPCGPTNITVTGSAQIKSGEQVVTCSISRDSSPDTDIDNYSVVCQ